MLLEVNQLYKSYHKRGQRVTAVSDVSFQLDGGQILGFLGPNGAGKTTTIKMIAGLIAPDDGDATIAGESVTHNGQRAIRHVGAVLEGSRNLYWRLSPLENLEYWAGLRGVGKREARIRAKDLLERFELSGKMNQTVQQLSRGMQQKVAICTALIHQPKLLLLDEPTLGLDLESSDRIQALVQTLVREQNIGVVLTTHQMDVAQTLSHRIAIISAGEIVLEGQTRDVLNRFTGNAYLVELGQKPEARVRLKLEADGAVFESERSFRITVANPEDLYIVLKAIEPAPILRIVQDTADLGRVFRHYVGGQEHREL
jgi:ABC-2 type transport system ATP-binding protein